MTSLPKLLSLLRKLTSSSRKCMTDNSAVCSSALTCAKGCDGCDANDVCNVNYHEAQCNIKAHSVENHDLETLSYDGCLNACILSSISSPTTYFSWDDEKKICKCFEGGQRDCVLQVVKAKFSLDQINSCKSG